MELHDENSNIGQQSKSHELKSEMDEMDDDEIQIPPFPTSHNLLNNSSGNMMNEGVDENNLGIVGIGGDPLSQNVVHSALNNKKKLS